MLGQHNNKTVKFIEIFIDGKGRKRYCNDKPLLLLKISPNQYNAV